MDSGNNGSNGKNGFTKFHYMASISLAAIGILGAAAGVYSSLNATISSNIIAISDIRKDIQDLKSYNSELRSSLLSGDQETRSGMRILAEKLIDCSRAGK